jgi:hypothetical protein
MKPANRASYTIFLTMLLCAVSRLSAQDPFPEDDFFLPEPIKAPWLFDWGSTVSPAALFESAGGVETLVAGLSGNLWVRLSLPAGWQYYARVRDNALLTVLPLTDGAMTLSNIWELNANYLQLVDPEAGLTLAFGRKPFLLGSGLALSGIGDGLDFQLTNPLFSVQAFGFYTGLLDPGFSSYGLNAWDESNGARRYVGGYSIGVGIQGHEVSLLGLYQGDFGLDPDVVYTSWYTGLQAKGMLRGGDYLVEWYLQKGYSPSGTTSSVIEAFGGTCRYQKVFAVATRPSVTVQYSLASGDADRTSTDGATGNASGLDAAFQGFGQVASGSVFRPYFSNIHIAQLGASFRPLEAAGPRIRDSSVGLKYFYYMKYAEAGVVNSGEADLLSHDLGHGIDLVLRWAPYNDVSTFLNAGLFLPGAAFPAGEPLRYTISGGMSLSF